MYFNFLIFGVYEKKEDVLNNLFHENIKINLL